MTTPRPKKQWLAIGAVIAVTVVLGAFIVGAGKNRGGDDHGHGHEQASEGGHQDGQQAPAAPTKGPRGGRLLADGDYAVEVTIFETGVEPQFRLYTYQRGKPLDPAGSRIVLTLERLGQPPQTFGFRPQGDHLAGDGVVSEPHSFKVAIEATHDGKTSRLGYEQVEARVTMTDAQLQSAGVDIATAGPATIATTLRLLGEVRYNADRTVQVVPRLAGLVEQVSASAGDAVRKGQVLAVLSSQALADQRADLLASQRRLTLARSSYERERRLWEEKISAEQDMLQARTALHEAEIAVQSAQNKAASLGGPPAGGSLTRYELRAPIDGIVTEKRISLGEAVKEDSAVFTVSDLSSVWVEAPVAASDLGSIATGQAARVRGNAFDAQAEARVHYISALVGEQTRNAVARLVVPNPKGVWRPGLPVTVEVRVDERQVPVAVAADAVQDLDGRKVVFGRYGTQLEARPLALGASDGRHVEVRAGLRAGERYAATHSFVVKAELGKAGASHGH